MFSRKGQEDIKWSLRERVKELTALHQTARLLQDNQRTIEEVMPGIVALIPPAWQYPEITVCRIRFEDMEFTSGGFAETEWMQSAQFMTGNSAGGIDVCYLERRPEAFEGPFLAEERDLINSLAEMLRSYLQHKQADIALQEAHNSLEQQVADRTAELKKTNEALEKQIDELKRAERKIEINRRHLRKLASEITLAEERERRRTAEDLHDHIGQSLAFIKMRLSQFQGNAIFCGFEDGLNEIMALLNQTIEYTRNLTFEISPPILYELGLVQAINWLAERYQARHALPIKVSGTEEAIKLEDEIKVMIFKSVQELLTNVVKHASATEIDISLIHNDSGISVEVKDNGVGFDIESLESDDDSSNHFGLFSIRERFQDFGGQLVINSKPGQGTSITMIVSTNIGGTLHEN